MSFALIYTSPALIASGWAFLLATIFFARRRSAPFWIHAAVFLATMSIAQASDVMLLFDMPHVLVWRNLSFSGELLSVPPLLFASLSIMDFRKPSYWKTARWRAVAVLGIALALTGVLWLGGFFVATRIEAGTGVLVLGSFGRAAYLFIGFAAVLALSHLEQLLRQSPDPIRYRFKLVWVGLGGMMAYELFRASQYLLIGLFEFADAIFRGSVSLLCLGLISWGLVRTRGEAGVAHVSVSEQALYGSITVIMAGVYFIAVGGIGELIVEAGQAVDPSIWSFVLFLCAISLVLLSTSRVFWIALHQMRARFLHRSKYDYRAKWIEVADALSETTSVDMILDRFLQLLGGTFGAGRISIWLRFDADKKYHQVRTLNRIQATEPVESTHRLVLRMQEEHEPIETEAVDAPSDGGTSLSDPFLNATHAALIVPVKAAGSLLGFVTLSRDPYSGQYRKDDRDLLRGIACHVGVLLAHAKLTEEQVAATRFEAFHELSAFCLHDIKNLAHRLSLVVQNAKVHSPNSAFVESAFKTIAGTVEKMNELMVKLAGKSAEGPEPSNNSIDLDNLVQDVVRSLPTHEQVVTKGSVDKILLPLSAGKLRQVLYNLLLNATQAGPPDSQIRVEMKFLNNRLVLSVADSGPGIAKDNLRTLFIPFRSTKPLGFGVGLYHAKRLVESVGGSILVESERGSGTTVQIALPSSSLRNEDFLVPTG
ncbi:MAG: XrtA/PEP-CTERM system histidine kinase PrsK [Nitrospiraceae bacterium]